MRQIVLTMDTDFVSEEVLEYSLTLFSKYNIKLNLFITGPYECINNYDFIQVYPHPNFGIGSSHGTSVEAVMQYMNSLQVSKTGFRSHKYLESNDINEYMKENGYRFKSNVCTDMQPCDPFVSRCGLLEFPIFFEDGGYLKYHDFNLSDVTSLLENRGVTTLLFHPMHLALNSIDFDTSRNLKDSVSYIEYSQIKISDLKRIRKKEGIETFLSNLLDNIETGDTYHFSDLLELFDK